MKKIILTAFFAAAYTLTAYSQANLHNQVIVKYNRYAVSLTITTPNNVDSQIIGFVCGLSSDLQNIGLQVIVSGTLKKFNNDENMTPEIAGQDLYFFEISQITKKL